MYLTETGVIMNRSEMRKFGIKVAELVATMRANPKSKPIHAIGSNGYDATSEGKPLQ